MMSIGAVVRKTLGLGEKVLVAGDSILSIESSASLDIRFVGSIAAAVFYEGEGVSHTEMTGPGTLWL